MEQTDNQYVARALAQDERAFEVLVERYIRPLYSFVFLVVRDQDLAEDVVQETFIKAWQHLKRFDTQKNFKTWLYTIAKNTAFDFLKKKKSVPFSSFEDEEGNMTFEPENVDTPDILELLTKEEDLKMLDDALAELPLLYRTLLLLVYREDFTLQEAAQLLHEPYNTVKSRHQRAVVRLRTIVKKLFASKEHVLS